MNQLGLVSVLVSDYDEAIEWFVETLGFELVEDSPQGDKRWVVVRPRGGTTGLLLARASGAEQRAGIGAQAAGRVLLFLETDDFERDHRRMVDAGVHFIEQPRDESYGRVAVFEDLCGNRWDLIEPG